MTTEIQLIAALGVLYLIFRFAGHAYFKFRGKRVITCPENKEFAAVDVDAKHAAITAVFGKPELRLKDCSCWPERENCGQECLRQIGSASEACLLRNILTTWYEGKSCAYCAKTLGVIDWMEHKPALMSAEGMTVEWHEVAPEKVYAALSTHQPVCWNCHIAEKFRREHAELIVDRPQKSIPSN